MSPVLALRIPPADEPAGEETTGLASMPKESRRMYAIAFDLDTDALKKHYPNASWANAYQDIRGVLEKMGFKWQQGSTYFGDEAVNAIQCVLAAQALSAKFKWLKPCCRDIRMLRIEEFNDLKPAL